MEKYAALAELRSRYPWIEPMLFEILQNNLWLSFGHKVVATSPSQVTLEQGSHMGKSLAIQLAWEGRATSATHSWARGFPALTELQAVQPWFFVMVLQIGQSLLVKGNLGMYMRVLFCGMLTYLDLGSDILVIRQYLESGELTGALLSLGFLALNLILQIAICVIQHFRNPPVMWREIFYTLILLKPGLEVLRILFGEEQQHHQTFSLIQENSFSKGIEVAAESLPAALTQLFFYVRTTDPTGLQLASIIVSIATTAVTVASVDYNVNTDPRSCATEHGMAVRFLGLIPDGNVAQFRLFAVMICCSFTQMTVAVLGTALLADYDSRIAIGMWAGRFASMYAIKILRIYDRT
jgi:hypothetical protein